MKKLLSILVVLGVIFTLAGCKTQTQAIKLVTRNVETIQITDGTTGKFIDLTEEQKQYMLDELGALTFSKEVIPKNDKGFTYGVRLLDKDGETIDVINILSESRLADGLDIYKTVDCEIDLQFFKSLFYPK